MKGSYDPSPILTYTKRKGYLIHFFHVPTDKSVQFPAFLTSYSDNYTSSWNPTSVFGRMDPIQSFQQTSRSISFAIDIPSADQAEAKVNLESVRLLTKFLYPTYQNKRNATTITKAPLVRIKFVNLIGQGLDGKGRALLGKMQTVAVNPDVEAGFFDPQQMLYPKVLKLDISFDVLHEYNPRGYESIPETPVRPRPTKPTAQQIAAQEAEEERKRLNELRSRSIAAGFTRDVEGLSLQPDSTATQDDTVNAPETAQSKTEDDNLDSFEFGEINPNDIILGPE